MVYGNAVVRDFAVVDASASVYGDALVCENAWVSNLAQVYGEASIFGTAIVYGRAEVYDNARIGGTSKISFYAKIHGNVTVMGRADIREFADLSEDSHYFTVGPIGSRNDFTTFYRGEDGRLYVSCGCFKGSVPEFVSKVRQTHEDSLHAAMYLAATDLALLKIDQSEDDGGNGGNDGNSDKA